VTPKSAKPLKAGVDPRLFRDILNLAKGSENTKMRVTDRVIVLSGTVGDSQLTLACSRTE